MNVSVFYIGNNGAFDHLATSCVQELQDEYPHIRLYIVLAYMPGKKLMSEMENINTIYPDGLETIPQRFAIVGRNRWMARHCEYAIVYIRGPGGAATAADYAKKQGVKIYNLAVEEGAAI